MAVKEKEKDKAEKEDAEKKKDQPETQDRTEDEGNGAEASEASGTKSIPSLGSKIFRVSVFAFVATFLTAFLFADPIPNGLRVEFDLLASVKLALICAVIAAVLRAVAGMLPIFADD